MPVRVIVGGPVSRVEVLLDGRPAALMQREPWTSDVELGAEIVPHELVARALASDGREVAACRQWLNLPRPPAEVDVLLERGVDGRATAAQLSWQVVTGRQPKSVEVRLNGKGLEVSAERRVGLPAYDAAQPQLLSVELEFDNNVRSRKDVVLGGASGSEAGSELTSIPIRRKSGEKEPSASALQGRFLRKGEKLSVAAVETGPATLWIVRDSSAVDAALHLGERGRQMFASRWGSSGRVPAGDLNLTMEAGDRMRYLWPRPVTIAGGQVRTELFPSSRTFLAEKAGLRWLLTSVHNAAPENVGARFADAVAVAGINAYAGLQRRAVLLLLGQDDVDQSQYAPEAVRRYLSRLHVPLFVWSLGTSKAAAVWGEARDVSTALGMLQAFADLRQELASQRIVWVEGRILPQEIELAAESGSIELVR